MNPIIHFGLGLTFFARFVSKNLAQALILALFFLLENFLLKLQPKLAPKNQKSWLRPWYEHVKWVKQTGLVSLDTGGISL